MRMTPAAAGSRPAMLAESKPLQTAQVTYFRIRQGLRVGNNCDPTSFLADVREFMWYEEWDSWAGVEAHGATAHGQAFHAAVDSFIEEEWTFYQAPFRDLPVTFDPAELNVLPCADRFFNSPERRGGLLRVVHLQTDDRAALLAAYAESRAQEAAATAAAAAGAGVSAGAGAGATGSAAAAGYAILLENRFERGQFVLLAEGAGGSASAVAAARASGQVLPLHVLKNAHSAWLAGARRYADLSDLAFGPQLWPEDVAAAE